MNTKNPRVALLVGGWSAERQVSLDKGKAVAAALESGGFDFEVIDVQKDISALIERLSKEDGTPRFDVVFNNLYGRGGEDGQIQSLLELLEIPYTHSGVTASAAGMDKALSKRIATSVGVPTAPFEVYNKEEFSAFLGPAMDVPHVVKPVAEGSSVGVTLVKTVTHKSSLSAQQLQDWVFGDILVEAYVPGKELTVAVLDGKAQAVTDIQSQEEFFDYKAKYQATDTRYVLPADIPPEIYQNCLDYAEKLYKTLGCRGIARCDFRYCDLSDIQAESLKTTLEPGLYFLEINTQPGLTAESIGPSQVAYNGMSFPELCAHLVYSATCEAHQNKLKHNQVSWREEQQKQEQQNVQPKQIKEA